MKVSGRAEHAFVVAALEGDLAQPGGVLAAVVGTEEQIGAAGKDGANSGAGAASVTTLRR